MATIEPAAPTTPPPVAVPITDPLLTTPERSTISQPIGWSSIFAATAVAVGTWLVLHLFGIGVGLTAIEPDDASTLRGVGVGTGIWSLIAPIVALFIGGLVAGRVAPTINTLNAAIHGAVVWALTAILTLIVLTMMIGSMVRGLAATGQAVGNVAGAAVSATASGARGAPSLGIDAQDLIAPINERLKAQGMPPVSPENVEAAAREALQTAVRQGGQIDQETLVSIVARETKLSRNDAQQLAGQLEERLRSVIGSGGQALQSAQQTALQAAETTGKLVLVLSITMLLALAAAIAGSILSVRRERREHVVLPRAMTR